MSWLDDWTGKTAKNALMASNKAATKALDQGYGKANTYYDEAAGGYTPYVESGVKGQNALMDALGFNGAEGSTAAYGRYMASPAFDEANNLMLTNLQKKYNASPGGGTGGAATLALARAGLEGWNGYVDRLTNLGSTGFAATGARSGVRQGQGDMAMGYGATKAGKAINYGNALAAGSTTGINNLMGLAGLGIKGYSAMYPKG